MLLIDALPKVFYVVLNIFFRFEMPSKYLLDISVKYLNTSLTVL